MPGSGGRPIACIAINVASGSLESRDGGIGILGKFIGAAEDPG